MKFIWTILAIGSLGYIGVCLFLYVMQEQAIFYPDLPGRQLEATPLAVNLEYEDVYATTADGESIHGWYIPAAGAKLTLLFCHGNAGNISHRLESIALFNYLGLNVLIFDYRGYGQSTGSISEAGFYQDAEAMWRFLLEQQGKTGDTIVVFGRSLGAAIASQLATQVKPAGVILESAFSSVPDMAARLYPFLPVRLLTRYKLNNIAHVKALQSPLLVIHSRNDEIIPFTHGEAVFAAAHEPKDFLPIQGDHNGGFLSSGRTYTDGVVAFLTKHHPGYRPEI